MDISSWLLLGLIFGMIAYFTDSNEKKSGFFGAIILGITGALVGGLIATIIIGIEEYSNLGFPTYSLAVLGSLILLFVGRVIRKVT